LFGLKKTLLYSLFADQLDPRDWMSGAVLEAPSGADTAGGRREYWFDFVCDTGDSQRAAYSLGYLLHGDLFVDDPHGALRAEPFRAASSRLAVSATPSPGAVPLPRGEFLFVGGDTAYSVADERTIQERLVAPFDYAHLRRFGGAPPPSRWLLGIPGNHDWYDSLDGFNRLFRRAVGAGAPPLSPRGFERVQQASYFALNLGDGWALWALDARDGADVDHRQRTFFRQQPAPRHLIIATPQPAVGYGRRPPWVSALIDEVLPHVKGSIRLWTSGDLHHYARYELGLLEGADAAAPGRAVTSVTCGLGGASLHVPWPLGSIPAAAMHPEPKPARREVQRRLLSPGFVLRMQLWAPAALIGAVLGFAAGFSNGEGAALLKALIAFCAGSAAEIRAPFPWVLIAILALVASAIVAPMLTNAQLAGSESEARAHSIARRAASALGPPLLVIAGIAYLALSGARTLGSIVVDVAFYLVLLPVLVALPYALQSDVPPRRAGPRAAAIVMPLGLMLVYLVITLGTAHGVATAWQPPGLPEAGAFVSALIAGAVSALLLPLLVGVAFALGMLLGSQLMVASSLAHIDRYQAFIRFCLRSKADGSSCLTGYVVGVTRTVSRRAIMSRRPDPQDLVPSARLIDVFRLEAPESGADPAELTRA
jgi:hypothetical protein